jgi:HK97 family phage prohead protease
MAMMRAAVAAEMTPLGEDEVEVIISTSALARDGHVLEPAGCDLTNYRANPVVLWQHNPDQPVGRATDLAVEGARIRARITFAPSGISPKADEVRGLVKNGIVSGISVGFDVLDSEPLDPKQPFGGQRFTKWELLECSFCSVPVDTGAMVTARAQTQEILEMTNIQTRAGKVLSAANKAHLDAAAGHLQRATAHHKALGKQLDALPVEPADNVDPEDVADRYEEVGDTHRALGRALRAAHRCLRAAIDSGSTNSGPPDDPDDDEQQIETSAGDGQQDGARSADLRRRKADLLALSRG